MLRGGRRGYEALAVEVVGQRAAEVPSGATVVCVLTGNGLKDPDFALSRLAAPTPIPATLDALAEALAL